MSSWNYVATAQKPSNVSHSCAGSFTASHHRNLIIAKSTRIEIHLLASQGLQLILDVPIYGTVVMLELFRPHGETQDLLFIVTEKNTFCVLQWDSDTSELVTRATWDVEDISSCAQFGVIDPDRRLVGILMNSGLFKVIPLDNKGHPKEAFPSRIWHEVLDMKFLYGCLKPTIAVLYQGEKDARHVKTYEVPFEGGQLIEGPWSGNNLDHGAAILIPVPPPLHGALIIGGETIVYYNTNHAIRAIQIKNSFTEAYGRVDADGSSYLLSDRNTGLLHRLVIIHEKETVIGLVIEPLGETSIASTISYLDNAFVYIGSSSEDSQLIKLRTQPDPNGSYVDVRERFVNLGPIVDFCVVDLERQKQVVTCSGTRKGGSLRVVRNGIGINQQVSVELQGIKGMWSLRSSTDDRFDTFLVVSFINKTQILTMNIENELEETEIEGFASQVQTLFCHEAVNNQLVQITSTSVRLVCSVTGKLKSVWTAPFGNSIEVATAVVSQVLLATRGSHLVYLEIGDGILRKVTHSELEHEILCLDISPIADNPYYSGLAAVGMCTDIGIRMFSLPDLNLITNELLGGEIIPCSILLSNFDGMSCLLCGLGDGHLLSFQLNARSGELSDRRKISLGTRPVTLSAFSSKSRTTHVFCASERPTVMYSSNKKLLYSNVNLNQVTHICPFSSSAFPHSLAIAKEGELVIGTVDDIQKFHIRSIPLGEEIRGICHQERSRTFAVCTIKYDESGGQTGFVRILNDQTFDVISTYTLDTFECGCRVISCSFSDDSTEYYCVGTVYTYPGEYRESEGRILVFKLREGKLHLITEKLTNGAVYTLTNFNGKLLASIHHKIQLYKWTPSRDLQSECAYNWVTLILCTRTRGDFILVGDHVNWISLLIYKHEKGAIEQLAWDQSQWWLTAVEILDDDVFLGAKSSLDLFTVRKRSDPHHLDVFNGYHLGEFVNVFHHVKFDQQIPTVVFGCLSGAIGVVASLPPDQYMFLEKLQKGLRKVIKGVGGLSHEQWRSFKKDRTNYGANISNFVDGDIIEAFLDLDRPKMDDISTQMGVPVDEIWMRVQELTRLHS